MIFKNSQFLSSLLTWFDQSRRDLPWRLPRDAAFGARLDPYHVLVSEAMLQQTQVSTVIPYFNRFTETFPTVHALAVAELTQVLRLWQGLGYYSRARNLHAAARKIVADFTGNVPDSVDALLSLPGIGRYTAGAIASIAYNRRAPILDGNVARVLCRLDAIRSDPRDPTTRDRLWQRAEEILPGESDRIGDFNSALMELGATVCTPRNPQCLICPVRAFCKACTAGIQDRIPPPRKAKPTPLVKRWTFCIHRSGKYLIEQRPPTGRWASLWQFITFEVNGRRPTVASLAHETGLAIANLKRIGALNHTLTHRRYRFDVYRCVSPKGKPRGNGRPQAWVRLADLHEYPLPRPHVKIAEMLRSAALSVKA